MVGSSLYLAMVFLLPRVVPEGGLRGPVSDFILAAHNLVLSAGSLVMTVGCIVETVRRMQREGHQWAFCEDEATPARGPLFFWSYMFYVSKYYEMFDTVIALLRGSKPPHFVLHVYHHALVPPIVWCWIPYRVSLQFLGLPWNTGVHVVMYFYYFCKVAKIPTPWKSWVTRIQIIQFVTSLVLFCGTMWYVYIGKSCAGLTILAINIVFNLTLLQQFIGVLFTNTKKSQSGKKDGVAVKKEM